MSAAREHSKICLADRLVDRLVGWLAARRRFDLHLRNLFCYQLPVAAFAYVTLKRTCRVKCR